MPFDLNLAHTGLDRLANIEQFLKNILPTDITVGNVVTSVFGRTGVVAATTGDYTAAQVTNAADKSSASTQSFSASISVALTGGATGYTSTAPAGTFTETKYTDGNVIMVTGENSTGGYVRTTSNHPLLFLANAAEIFRIIPGTGLVVAASNIISSPGAKLNPITSGALSTISPVSGTALQVSTTRDVFLMQTCTFNPTAGASATCVVAISPDNVTFSTLITATIPVGVTFDGTIPPISLQVPASWWVKFTTTNATLGTGTYY